MRKNGKKFLAVLLSAGMILSTATAAFAEGPAGETAVAETQAASAVDEVSESDADGEAVAAEAAGEAADTDSAESSSPAAVSDGRELSEAVPAADNAGEGQIFLISLRAGGSGLNLTGADVVIHYDPWWNPAAEDQATDRAHRIGQTRKVDVIRLVCGDSIEEKVVELGERKKALFDRLITPGESGLQALSEQEIRSLFD